MATCREKTGKAADEEEEAKAPPLLRQAAPGEARRINGPKRTSSRGCGSA
jgi:hypothetical protein